MKDENSILKIHKKKYHEPTLRQLGLVKKVTQKSSATVRLDHGDQHHTGS